MKPLQLERRHFQFIADILKDLNADSETVTYFAQRLKSTNANFQADKFTKAATK
jgi:hypothetical protein